MDLTHPTLAAFVLETWGLEATFSRLGGENENHLVTTGPGRRYVLKLGDPGDSLDEIGLEQAAVEAVHAAGIDVGVPRVVPTRGGSPLATFRPPDGPPRPSRLLSFVEGTLWDDAGPASPSRLREAGGLLGRLPGALAAVESPALRRSHRWDLTKAGALRSSVGQVEGSERRRMAREAFRLWAGAEPFLAELPRGLIHGDVNGGNLLVQGDRIVGLLDFGDTLVNPLICDLAIAMAYLLLDCENPMEAGAHLVAGYHGVRPLSSAELELLFPLVCGRLGFSVVQSAVRRGEDPDRTAWFVTEAPAWRALERYLQLDPVRAAEGWSSRIEVPVHVHRGAPPARLVERRRARFSGALSLSFREPVKFVRGRGSYLFDELGWPYLDLYNNVCHVGHCHPRVVAAGQAQMARLNTNSRYLYDALYDYADRLTATLPPSLDHCFLVNSGSEANELALRLARAHTGRHDVIVLENAYHGHTQTLIDVSPYKFRGPGGRGRQPWVHVAPMPDGYRGPYRGQGREAGVAYGDAVGRLVREMPRPPAAFIAESRPSVGGQIIPPEGYFETAFRHVREAGGVCILDEVQVGFGRVGSHFWGFEQQGVVPDVVVMGKPIGNGHPLGAVVTTEAVARSFAETGMEFFSTFGGNPVSCAIGTAVLDVVRDEGLQEHALRVGSWWKTGPPSLQPPDGPGNWWTGFAGIASSPGPTDPSTTW
ncbi:MAG: aminotransferase class III-fold pyridoxal phosphate-dependent enzyme [Gemmatimonadota bacterium]